MRYEHDAVSRALYVYLQDDPIARQVEMDDGVIVDIGASDRAVGLEVLSPEDGWDAEAIIDRWGLDDHTAGYLRFLSVAVTANSGGSSGGGASRTALVGSGR